MLQYLPKDNHILDLIAKAASVFIYEGGETLSALKHVKAPLRRHKTES